MKPPDLDTALQDYADKLLDLEQAESLTSEQILAVLASRDRVEAVLPRFHKDSPTELLKLVHLDSRLKHQSQRIAQVVNLEEWRSSIKPKTDAWWWQFDAPAAIDVYDRLDWLWNGVSIAALTASVSLIVDISARFLAGGPDVFGAFTVTVQTVVTLLTAQGALTKSGQGTIEKILASLSMPKRFQQEAKMGLAIALMFGLIGFRSYLPQIAQGYVQQGLQNQNVGKLTQAQKKFERAQELDPSNVEVHYRLGNLYESLQEFDRAQTEYRLAAKGGYEEAYNNLARLHILDKKPAAAVALLLQHLQYLDSTDIITLLQQKNLNDRQTLPWLLQTPNLTAVWQNSIAKYFMLKNLGWARLEQKRYADAQANLTDSLDMISTLKQIQQKLIDQKQDPKVLADLKANLSAANQGASAHCLMAQTLEAQGNQRESLAEWTNCLAFANQLNPDEDVWIHQAQQRLSASEK